MGRNLEEDINPRLSGVPKRLICLKNGRLGGNTLVSTIMSNFGLDEALITADADKIAGAIQEAIGV